MGRFRWVMPALVAASIGCASLATRTRAACEWLEVLDQEGLIASGNRILSEGHNPPHMCGTTDRYTLTRSRYVIEAWNSDWTSPVLFLRVMNLDGVALEFDSADLEDTAVRGKTVYRDKGMQFTHVFHAHRFENGDARPRSFPFELRLRVVGANGTELGTESLTIVKRAGHFYFREG